MMFNLLTHQPSAENNLSGYLMDPEVVIRESTGPLQDGGAS